MKKDIKKETLNRIRKNDIKPKPKSYFAFLRAAIYSASFVILILAIYIFNLMFYLPERALRMAENGNLSYLSLFPWPLLIIGSIVVAVLLYLYRNYEGGYKKHIGITALIVFFFVLLLGMGLSRLNLNEQFEKRPGFRQFYQWNDENFVPRGPRNGQGKRLMHPIYENDIDDI
ncbi:MAG: hypothetical protein PHW75_00590 [Patescibacteria group bacterium]|nr:hypothetical protein [Patescibacteria group bacterium]